jgi:hypothetical protein
LAPDADVLGDSDGLTFVEQAETVAFLDTDVLDTELGLVPLLHMRLLIDDQRAQVAGVEHDDVRGLRVGVEVHERGDQENRAILAGRA